MHPLILSDITPLHWAWVGLGIAAISVLLKGFADRSLGISTGYDQLCGMFSSRKFFHRKELLGKGRWRLPFLAGLVFGGLLSVLTATGGWQPIWGLGMFDARISDSPTVKLLWMFGGGILAGAGARIAGGCASGHGVFGMAAFEKASLIAVPVFMGTGVLTANVLWRLLAPGH